MKTVTGVRTPATTPSPDSAHGQQPHTARHERRTFAMRPWVARASIQVATRAGYPEVKSAPCADSRRATRGSLLFGAKARHARRGERYRGAVRPCILTRVSVAASDLQKSSRPA